MSNTIENQVKKHEVSYEVNGENVSLSPETVRNFLVSGKGNVTTQEIMMFTQLCRYQKLNPFLNEAYLVKYGDQPASIITSKEAFMKRADKNVHYNGFKAGVVVARGDEMKRLEGAIKMPNDQLIGGWADVERDDRKEPIHVEIQFEEFAKYKFNYKTRKRELQSTWKTMPMTMIRKTALVNALREAFPESLGAMYTEDDKQPVKDINAEESENEDSKETVSNLLNEPNKKDENKKDTKHDENTDTTDDKPAKDVTPKPKNDGEDNSHQEAKDAPKEGRKQTDEELFAELKANNGEKKEDDSNDNSHEEQGKLFDQINDTNAK